MSKDVALTVQVIDRTAWEGAGIVEPLGEPIPLAELLAQLPQHRLALRVLPASRIAGGAYAGGHVLIAQNGDRLYIAVPPAAIPQLAGVLPADEYAALVRRTPAVRPDVH
ncbi:MAG TPA: hypothetical protein VFU72_01770 [Nitrolancea sp.]|nr:hypothetical protein [Nitrolancea sp.]